MTAGVVIRGGRAEGRDRLVRRLVAEGINRVALVGPSGGSAGDSAGAVHAAIDRLRRDGELPHAIVLLDATIEMDPGLVPALAGALASDDRLWVVTADPSGGSPRGVVLIDDGGVPSGATAVRGDWFERGYRFPRDYATWFGLDDLVLDVRAAGGLIGRATDLPMHVPDPMAGNDAGDFGPVNAWAAEREAFWARRGAHIAAAVEAAAARALGRPVPTTPSMPMEVINLARRPDRLQAFRQVMEARAGADVARLVERREAVDGRDLVASAELESLVVPNSFGSRRGVIGCALSHISVWTDAARGRRPVTLVLEDDSEPVPGFLAALEQVVHQAAELTEGWDVILLDYFPEVHDRSDLWSTQARQLRPMRWERYRGGLYGYLISDRGAQRLLDLLARHRLPVPIDRFLLDHSADLTSLEVRPSIVSPPFPMVAQAPDSDIEHDPVALFP